MGRDDDGRPTLFGDDEGGGLKPWQRPTDPRTLARSADPPTSHAAAERLDAGRAGTVRRRLLAQFVRYPSLTADEATSAAGFDASDGAWKRVSDLKNLGLVEATGETRAGSSGRQQQVLRATEAGREAMTDGR